MEVEVIHGQIIAKANHYQAVPGKFGQKRIIKDEWKIQCKMPP